ncbi:peptide deformylase [compost metagenome]
MEASELLARAIQHEIDHLDGKLFVDMVEDKDALERELVDFNARMGGKIVGEAKSPEAVLK